MSRTQATSPRVIAVTHALADWHHLTTDQIRRFTDLHPSKLSRTLNMLRRSRVVERSWIATPPPPIGFVWRLGPAAEKWRAALPKDLALAVTSTAHISRRRGALRHDLAAASLALALRDNPLVSRVLPEWESSAKTFVSTTTSGARGDLTILFTDNASLVIEITADMRSAGAKALRWARFVQNLSSEDDLSIVFLSITSRVPLRYLRRSIERVLSFEGMGSLTEGLAPPWTVSLARERIFVAHWTDWIDEQGKVTTHLPAQRLTDEDTWEEGVVC